MISDRKNVKIGFVGVGNMASAIIAGITSSECFAWNNIYLYDIFSQKTDEFAKEGANKCSSASEVYASCDCVVLAVKPQNYPEVLGELSNISASKDVLVITIAAGITTKTVSAALHNAHVVRALPNTPIFIGRAVTALCKNDVTTDEEFELVKSIFEASGETTVIDENEMNRIISVISSSPAYVFKFIKAICDGADAQGLDGKALLRSVCAVVSGSAEMLAQSEKSADELVSMVCSKGGTTERAVAELDAFDFEAGIVSAMKKCTARADELSNIKK